MNARLIAVLITSAASFAAPNLASAQSGPPCGGASVDSFIGARRARRALEDYEQISAQFSQDLELLSQATQDHDILNPPRLRFYGGPVLDANILPSLDTCTSAGSWPGAYQSIRLGGVFGIEELKWGLGLRFYLISADDTLNATPPGQAPADDTSSTPAPKLSASQAQRTMALRLQLTRWFALTFAQLQDSFTLKPLEQGLDQRVSFETQTEPSQSERMILRLEIPTLQTSFDLILSGQDQAVETLDLKLTQLPLPKLPLELSAGLTRYSDEQQLFTSIGLDWLSPLSHRDALELHPNNGIYRQRSRSTHKVGVDTAVELTQPGLRWLRLRTSIHHQGNQNNEDPLAAYFFGQVYWMAGLYWEGSVFHGRYMREQTSADWAWGTFGGGYLGLGLRMMSIFVDLGGGANRPETLSRNVQAVDQQEFKVKMSWRVGF